MKKKAIVVLAGGFEEAEAVVTIDILRRAELEVTLAGVGGDSITGAHGVTIRTDTVLDDSIPLPDALVFPGGMPGAENLAGSESVKKIMSKMNSAGKIVAAICASPALVLSPAGILKNKTATCYPGMEKNFEPDVKFAEKDVVQSDNIITSRGPATAFHFGLKIAENLAGKQKADMVARQMLFG